MQTPPRDVEDENWRLRRLVSGAVSCFPKDNKNTSYPMIRAQTCSQMRKKATKRGAAIRGVKANLHRKVWWIRSIGFPTGAPGARASRHWTVVENNDQWRRLQISRRLSSQKCKTRMTMVDTWKRFWFRFGGITFQPTTCKVLANWKKESFGLRPPVDTGRFANQDSGTRMKSLAGNSWSPFCSSFLVLVENAVFQQRDGGVDPPPQGTTIT